MHGKAGVRSWMRSMLTEWAVFTPAADEVEDVGDALLIIGHLELVTRSGRDFRQPVTWTAEFRDGLFWRVKTYTDTERARRDLTKVAGGG